MRRGRGSRHGRLIPPAVEAAFVAAVLRLAGEVPAAAPGRRLGVAFSGGPDSLALLRLATRLFPPGSIHAATVDHGLQPDSAAWAARAAALAGALDVPCTVLLWPGAKPSAGVQAAARNARYRLLGDWAAVAGVRWLATAHHADDQAETLLARVRRGAGVDGLAGIRETRPLATSPSPSLSPAVTVIRPLLTQPRAALWQAAAIDPADAIDDPANRDPRYERTRLRRLLAGAGPLLPPAALAQTAAHAAEAAAALDWAASVAWDGRVRPAPTGGWIVDAAGLPRELQRRLLARAAGPEAGTRAGSVLLDRLSAGAGGTLGGMWARVATNGCWRIGPAPVRRLDR